MEKKLISRQAAADRAGVAVRTVDYWRRRGYLTTHRVRGHFVRVDQDELDQYIKASPEDPDSGPVQPR